MKKIIIGIMLVSLVLLTGCSKASEANYVYTDLPEDAQSMTKIDRINFCDSMCKNWGFRISSNHFESDVRYDDNKDVFYCACW